MCEQREASLEKSAWNGLCRGTGAEIVFFMVSRFILYSLYYAYKSYAGLSILG